MFLIISKTLKYVNHEQLLNNMKNYMFIIMLFAVVKLLGVHVDRYLTFNYHVSELYRKAARQVNCLMRLSTMLPVESKLTIFNVFIVSNFL